MKRNCAGESLGVKRRSIGGRGIKLLARYLYHDHREREDIPFFARRPTTAQDLRCGPSRSVAIGHGGLKRGFLTPGEAEICDARATGTINKNVGLQSSGKQNTKC